MVNLSVFVRKLITIMLTRMMRVNVSNALQKISLDLLEFFALKLASLVRELIIRLL